ncbi:L-fuconolactonase [Roseateles sp. YR242]|uniref:amidohydrolase family protein n=1 Tax=Roseateles sp. YR242 TaxID=1855305 RepID=UPI0008BD90EF|nr:amidohydrolase family protein [Roseateles sp. YR242]SEL85930.1 L-fuconolactonase [Roseateles sp. YR242]
MNAPATRAGRSWRVDAHQHFWQLADRVGEWPPASLAAIHRDFGPADLQPLRQRAGVDGTVLVQSLPTEQDTHWMLSLADRHDFIWGVVGWTDMKAPDAAVRVAALARHPKLRGLRPMLQGLSPDDWIADTAVDPAAHAMVAHGLVFDALVLPRQLAALEVFARRHPDLPIVIDHGAKPLIATGELEPWRTQMARLSALPQVCCKLSGLLTEAGDRANAEALRPFVAALLDLFGPQRLLWGSDWPVLCVAGGYQSWLDMSRGLLETLVPGLTDADHAAVFGGNAVQLYGLQPVAPVAPLAPVV